MRRKDRMMNYDDTIKALRNGIDGMFVTISENEYPYAVPVNYIYYDEKIYFHSAKVGHKIDNLKVSDKVSFTVVTRNEVLAKEFSTDFQSVIVFGKARLVEPSKGLLMEIIKKYSSMFMKEGKAYVDKSFASTQLVEITIDHITGKERK